MNVRIRRYLKKFGYVFALLGSAVGGFPPPRRFEAEEMPEEVMERVLEAFEFEDFTGEEQQLARRDEVVSPPHLRTPESPSR